MFSILFNGLRVKKIDGVYSIHKPLLLLLALSRCFKKQERMMGFSFYENELLKLNFLGESFPVQYPFIRLVNDGLWEVENYDILIKNSSGDVSKTILIDQQIKGGFTVEVYKYLVSNSDFLLTQVKNLLQRFFSAELQSDICKYLDLPSESYIVTSLPCYEVNDGMNTVIDDDAVNNISIESTSFDLFEDRDTLKTSKDDHQNGYISYLNSLHNISADGSNALAESQALNEYFSDLYVPFPLSDTIKNSLSSSEDKVIILTGHAGDGKSTVALDLFKHLKGYDSKKPLNEKLKEKEELFFEGKSISIVKDMSELSADNRLEWLSSAFNKPGSWLIISNTGPLLNSISRFVEQQDPGHVPQVENDILRLLDLPLQGDDLSAHTLNLVGTDKSLVILNMTRLNNIDLGSSVLKKIAEHSGWNECEECPIQDRCVLRKNRKTIQRNEVIDRVRWVYQRLTSYEQRLTLRQIVAHLAFSVTGGLGCSEAHKLAYNSHSTDEVNDRSLEDILFSESFFGYKRGEVLEKASPIKAIELLQRIEFGSPFAVDFERKMVADDSKQWIDLPTEVIPVANRWRVHSRDSAGVRWRFALRRMAYFYGQGSGDSPIDGFLDNFLQAPMLRQFDIWQSAKELNFSASDRRAFKTNVLRVLLEFYSGFSAGQFKNSSNKLYLTMRRPDRSVVQSTQIVIASISMNDFDVIFDQKEQLPMLVYDDAKLILSLPLLDYIQSCSLGNLGNQLVPIHTTQLELFRSKLIKTSKINGSPKDKLTVIRSGVDGTVVIRSYYIDLDKKRLEFV